ncbi:MAG: 5-oxoprolinase subunit PxpB [Acidobacteriota bacterium]
MYERPAFLTVGDSAVVVEYGDAIDEATNLCVRRLAAALSLRRDPGIIEIVPTYRSVMVHYDPLRVPRSQVEAIVLDAEQQLADVFLPPPRVIDIPTVYGGGYGPDLDDVAAWAGMAADEVIALHSGREYLVYMMGFMAGFPYLGGLSPRIAMPRLPSPRTKVPTGSVGIAQEQTGIYPTETPGGWRLIGWTPVRIFDASHDPPVLFEAGDYIRFVPASAEQAQAIASQIAAGAWTPTVRPRE